GTIVDQKKHASRTQAIDQAIQKRLRLTVDPVQILEDEHDRLHLRFSEQQPPASLQNSQAFLCRIEAVPRVILQRRTEQKQQSRKQRLELAIEHHQLA